MTRFIALIGGKGGCGKTTSSINLGASLNYFGKDVTIVDANLTTPNVGVHLGVPVVPISLHDALKGDNHISEAVYLHPSGTKIVPASLSMDDLLKTNPDNLKKTIHGLYGTTDFVLIDSAAGLGREAVMALESCDEVLIITNPELPALTDALKTINLAENMGKQVNGVILTRAKNNKTDISINNIESLLEKRVIAVIPEDETIREAQISKDSVIYTHPDSDSALAYKQLGADMAGIKNFNKEEKEGFFSKMMKAIGLSQ